MPKSKSVSAYPEIYFAIFEQVANGKPYHTPPLEPKKAAALRLDFYGFRAAIREEKLPQSRLWDSFKILINRHNEAPLRIIAEQEGLNAMLASTLEDVDFTESPDLLELEEDDMPEPDSGDVLAGLGFTPK